MAKRLAILKDLFSGFAADGATLVVGCLCGTRCSRDEIPFLCIFHIDVFCEVAVLNAADFALCKSNASCPTAAMVSLVVDLVAARALVPMRRVVHRPLFCPIMAERVDRFIRRVIAIFTSFIGLPAFLGTSRILAEMRYCFMPKRCYKFRTARRTRLRCRTRCCCARRMAGCCDLSICRVTASCAAARLIIVPPDFGTRCRLAVMAFEIMAERRDRGRISIIAIGASISARSCRGARCSRFDVGSKGMPRT